MMGDGLERVLWIGGAQWAGKTSVAQLLAVRHPLILYAYDYHDARSHAERSLADPERFPNRHAFLTTLAHDPDALWVRPSPEEMAETARRSFRERFEMVLEDLGSLPPGLPVLAEGWGLRPELVAPVLTSARQAIFLVPSEEFVERQIERVPRAGGFNPDFAVSDPARAQRNRLARNHLLTLDVVETAARLGLRVVTVDGSAGVAELAAVVEEHFRPFLPRWRY
jgi:hypothetical protein